MWKRGWGPAGLGSVVTASSLPTTATHFLSQPLATQHRPIAKMGAPHLLNRLEPVALASDAVPTDVVMKWPRDGPAAKLAITLEGCPEAFHGRESCRRNEQENCDLFPVAFITFFQRLIFCFTLCRGGDCREVLLGVYALTVFRVRGDLFWEFCRGLVFQLCDFYWAQRP